MSDKDVELSIGAEDTGLAAVLSESAKKVQESANLMKEAIEPVNAAFEKVQKVFMLFTAALAGGHAFKEAVQETVNWTKEANGLAKTLGITASEASVLNIALGDIYASSDQVKAATAKITKGLSENEESFKALGVQTREQDGHYRNSLDVMLDVNQALLKFREGTDRNVEGQKIYGKAWGEVAPLLKLNTELMEESRKKADELGLMVGKENVEATARYRAAMNELEDMFRAVTKVAGDFLLPILTDLGEWLSSYGPEAVSVMKGAMAVLTSAFYGLKEVVQIVWETIKAAVQQMTVLLLTLADVATKALAFDFTGAKAAWDNGMAQISEIGDQWMNKLVKDAETNRDKIFDVWAQGFGGKKPTEITQRGSGDSGDGKGSPAPKEKSRMAEWEAELAAQKAAFIEAHDGYEMSLRDEKKYWDEKLTTVSRSDKEYGALMKKSAELRLQIIKKEAAEGRAIKQEELDAAKAMALDGVAAEQMAAQFALDTKQITKDEYIQLEQQFEQERYQINRQALDDRIALLEKDPNMSPVEYRKLKDEILAIERKHQLDKQQLSNKLKLDKATPELTMFNSMEQSFATAITGMIAKANTLRQALNGIWQSVFGTFVQEMVSKPLAQMAARVVRETALYQALFGAQVTGQAAASTAVVGAKVGEAGAVIAADAGEAAAGAAASQAAIPVVGPGLAAGAFAATMAMVMGAKSLLSASGGFDIPAGVNPVTQLHQKEMVLPAKYADTIRDMAEGGGSGGGDVHFHIKALDAADVRSYLKKNSHAMAPGLRQLARNFTSTKG